MDAASDIDQTRPVLIAGPTASGKSALAMAIARAQGGVIVNADALQVYENWRILSARPDAADEAALPHRLYGHVGAREAYSAGHWLREVADLLDGSDRLIIVGGTGLYFTALTEGLAEIPTTPPAIRAEADRLRAGQGIDALLKGIDVATRARIDTQNPMRVQRAWEVQQATGRGLAAWQDTTPPPVLPISACTALLVEADKDWLNARIARRFDAMLAAGALEEVRANLVQWDPRLPSMKAIGAPELVAHLRGEISLDTARDAATTATRQYAKRQRSWFRARMRGWQRIAAETL
ncbi:tRNA dimethylallyltransferase [Roseovarius sp. A-2]|uniref:tRNA (adenosine(37)-N6)-dimethylallyltransferase MiaA n=1 Tax=Roseovarius sp. A-2 TaxID=1570360 RepID=UPI0009B54C11|nr:tRNA (adenosine(37)-N6)-dimethylallyltransferase MiaA [Roseovarius sp. A-2]GAW33366.1 tRNA dimethylallyltransferase [Roseovarius sp. A-2]